MGADFLFNSIPHFKLTESRKTQLYELVDSVEDAEILTNVDFLPFGIEDTDTDTDLITAVKQKLKELISDLDGIMDNREVSVAHWSGMDYDVLLTGGMSWGDSPTDTFDLFSQLGYFNALWNKMQEYAKSDFGNNSGPPVKDVS